VFHFQSPQSLSHNSYLLCCRYVPISLLFLARRADGFVLSFLSHPFYFFHLHLPNRLLLLRSLFFIALFFAVDHHFYPSFYFLLPFIISSFPVADLSFDFTSILPYACFSLLLQLSRSPGDITGDSILATSPATSLLLWRSFWQVTVPWRLHWQHVSDSTQASWRRDLLNSSQYFSWDTRRDLAVAPGLSTTIVTLRCCESVRVGSQRRLQDFKWFILLCKSLSSSPRVNLLT
jgi:hypothetical protein